MNKKSTSLQFTILRKITNYNLYYMVYALFFLVKKYDQSFEIDLPPIMFQYQASHSSTTYYFFFDTVLN